MFEHQIRCTFEGASPLDLLLDDFLGGSSRTSAFSHLYNEKSKDYLVFLVPNRITSTVRSVYPNYSITAQITVKHQHLRILDLRFDCKSSLSCAV